MHVTGLHRPLRKDDTPLDGGSSNARGKGNCGSSFRSGPPCFERAIGWVWVNSHAFASHFHMHSLRHHFAFTTAATCADCNLSNWSHCLHVVNLTSDFFCGIVVAQLFIARTVQETNWDAQREKTCVNTYAHASALQICLQNICGQQHNFRWLVPLLGPNLDPKTGPKQRPKRRNENVIQFWTPFWGPYLDPKMGSAIGEFRCCPHMLCKQICDPAAWTWMSTHTFFSLCVPSPVATVKVPLSQPCFDNFFGPCFRGHDEAGLLAFEALQGLPRPARGTRTKRGSWGLDSI